MGTDWSGLKTFDKRKDEDNLSIVKLENWTKEIAVLEKFFASAKLPSEPIAIKGGIVMNAGVFIENHLSMVKFNHGKHTFRPYLDRLIEFKEILTKN